MSDNNDNAKKDLVDAIKKEVDKASQYGVPVDAPGMIIKIDITEDN
jgi:hypothetical protein